MLYPMRMSDSMQENLLCLLAGLLCLAWIISMSMGDGSIGLFDIF
jgi:hypothetical protein